MVSDNSTLECEQQKLFGSCRAMSDSRLHYLRPPQPMSMPLHWNWAITRALASYKANHFLYLTDRMIFRPKALKELLEVSERHPGKVISYQHDRICDDSFPIRIEQYPATEKLIEVSTQRLSFLFSQGIFHQGLPRMLNCIVPRLVFERMLKHFGSVFSSIAPDFNFCVRCLDTEEVILFFDKSLLIHYGLTHSVGASASRGEITRDNADFIENLPVDNAIRNYATPIPSLITSVNAAFNEYLIYKQQTMSPRFFAVNWDKYLSANALEVREVRNPSVRLQMLALIDAHRPQPNPNCKTTVKNQRDRKHDAFKILSRLRRATRRRLAGTRTKQLWVTLSQRLHIRPPGEVYFEFSTVDEALDYTRNISRGNIRRWTADLELLEGRELRR
jgi:hypothetical protein